MKFNFTRINKLSRLRGALLSNIIGNKRISEFPKSINFLELKYILFLSPVLRYTNLCGILIQNTGQFFILSNA